MKTALLFQNLEVNKLLNIEMSSSQVLKIPMLIMQYQKINKDILSTTLSDLSKKLGLKLAATI